MIYRGVGPTLTLPPAEQGIYEYSATQKFELGTKFWYGERCFKYARTGATMTLNDRLAYTHPFQVSSSQTIAAAATAGATSLSLTIGTGEGVGGDGAVAADELIGAWLTVMKADAAGTDWADMITVMIVSNTVVAAGGGTMTVEIDNPIQRLLTATAVTDITSNLYRDVRIPNGSQCASRMVVGKPMSMATTTYPYFWLQTWGPFTASCSLVGEDAVGGTPTDQTVAVVGNGSLVCINDATEDAESCQRVGVVVTRLEAETQGTPLLYMQISC